MGQFKDDSIKNIIEQLNESYFLPDIQREYVWLNKEKEKKIEQLFDSILRGYPIGSFLFWKLKKNDIETNKDAEKDSDKLNFQLYKFIEKYHEKNKHNEKINIEQINTDDLSIVLDGQQRLTSLYLGLKGTRTLKEPYKRQSNPNAFKEKKLYVNIRYQPQEETPDDNFKFEFHEQNSLPETDEENFWFKVGDILSLDSIVKYSRDNDLSDVEAEILEKLKNAFCTKNIISYFEETEKNLDKVLKIFIRVNSGGTQLSYSDLLMSILTANFSSDVRTSMNKAVDSIHEEGFKVMGRDQVLKTCLLLTGSNHIFKLKNFSRSNIRKIEDDWEQITESIFKAINLLQEFGYRSHLSSAYILSIVAYFIFRKKSITDDDKSEILRFVRNAQITGYFSDSLDSKLEAVAKILRNHENFKDINNKLASNKTQPLKISHDDVEDMPYLQYGASAVLPILQLLYSHLDFKNSTFHIDHIYPKSKFNNKNKKLPDSYSGKNYLYNLQLLQGDENFAKKDKDPEVWLKKYFQNDNGKIAAYKERNYIEKDFALEWNNINEFESNRNERIKEKLHAVFGTKKQLDAA